MFLVGFQPTLAISQGFEPLAGESLINGTNKASTLPAHHGVRDLGLGKQAAMGI